MLQTKPQLNLILNREFNPLNIIWLPHVAEMIITLWSSLKSELMRTLNCLPVSCIWLNSINYVRFLEILKPSTLCEKVNVQYGSNKMSEQAPSFTTSAGIY